MSIQRSIQTGLMIGQTIQTIALRNQVAQMQQLALDQQQHENELASWRQLVFHARKTLDEAERALATDTVGAFYSISSAHLNLQRINDSIFPDFHEKEVLYQIQKRAGDLLAYAQTQVPRDTAQQLYRLAWLEEVRCGVINLITWQEVLERANGAALLFSPSPGLGRAVLLFFGGNIAGIVVAAVVSVICHPLGVFFYFAFNGITLNILDPILRNKVIKGCNAIAQKVGCWVGKGFTLKTGRLLVDQARHRLATWGYESSTDTARETQQALGGINDEIQSYRQLYFS